MQTLRRVGVNRNGIAPRSDRRRVSLAYDPTRYRLTTGLEPQAIVQPKVPCPVLSHRFYNGCVLLPACRPESGAQVPVQNAACSHDRRAEKDRAQLISHVSRRSRSKSVLKPTISAIPPREYAYQNERVIKRFCRFPSRIVDTGAPSGSTIGMVNE